jgi:phage terminase large subunit GpA-like protein
MIRTPHAAFAATAQADATYARSEPGGDLAGSIAECAAAASRGVYVVGIQTEVSKHELADILQEAERWRRRPEPLPPILP